MKTMKEITNYVCEKEAGKKEVSIGQIKEILSVLTDLFAKPEGEQVIGTMIKNGKRRAKRRLK
jgi:hypothetical protein